MTACRWSAATSPRAEAAGRLHHPRPLCSVPAVPTDGAAPAQRTAAEYVFALFEHEVGDDLKGQASYLYEQVPGQAWKASKRLLRIVSVEAQAAPQQCTLSQAVYEGLAIQMVCI